MCRAVPYVCGERNVSLNYCRYTFCDKRNYIYEEYRIQIGNVPLLHSHWIYENEKSLAHYIDYKLYPAFT